MNVLRRLEWDFTHNCDGWAYRIKRAFFLLGVGMTTMYFSAVLDVLFSSHQWSTLLGLYLKLSCSVSLAWVAAGYRVGSAYQKHGHKKM